MDFLTLSQHLVTFTFEAKSPDGKVLDTCEITTDANKFVGELDRRMGRLYAQRVRELDAMFKLRAKQPAANGAGKKKNDYLKLATEVEERHEREAKIADLNREVLADALASDKYGVINRWAAENVLRDAHGNETGREPMPPVFENLMRLPESRLEELLKACRDAARPKGQGETKTAGPRAGRKSRTTSSTSDSSTPANTIIQQHDELPN